MRLAFSDWASFLTDRRYLTIWLLAFIVFTLSVSPLMAKEPSLTAIEIFDGPSGATYLILGDVLINGKAEMHECDACEATRVDKAAYGKLGKLTLGPGGVLERGADGILRYSVGGGTAKIVVPVNARFDHGEAISSADLAEQAQLKATTIGPQGSTATPPEPLKKGVKLVFVAIPDLELAEYLRAERAGDIPGWQGYLAKYPAGAHLPVARKALAALFAAVGETYLAAYDKTVASSAPAYNSLKDAKSQAEKARALDFASPQLKELDQGIATRVTAIADQGRKELKDYQDALQAKAPGYPHLINARKFSDTVNGIDPTNTASQSLSADVLMASNKLESTLRTAESSARARQFDQAMVTLSPYRAFYGEESRVTAIVDGAYDDHIARGKRLAGEGDWERAIEDFQKASAIKQTGEASDLLKNAQVQLKKKQDREAADKAEETSKQYEAGKDIIRAYETLSSLPPEQAKLVGDDMERLEPAYVQAASTAAKNLQQAHYPIHGLADEISMERAYVYLRNAYELSENDSYQDRMGLLGEELSAYLLDQAKRYLAKPSGSGTELGWTYLMEAQPYKASNLDAVRDAQVAAGPAHAVRSRLSIRVQFRDQTSQRDSAGFTDQLENAIITGLEGSGIPVKVVRAGETVPVEPDFELVGDVLQHHLTKVENKEPVESKYRSGQEEVPNGEWTKVNRELQQAQMDFTAAQAALQGAAAKGKKKEIETENEHVQAAEKAVQDVRTRLDAIPEKVTVDVIRPYNYTKITVQLTSTIQVQFRVSDSLSGQRAELVPINEEKHKEYTVLENVKGEDTEGVRESGTVIDPEEFMTSVENAGLQELIEEVRKHVDVLPHKIYEEAKSREDSGDLDGAGEGYLRFLEMMPKADSPECAHAQRFLADQFNINAVATTGQ
jgi:hypothetical protein